MNDEWLVYSELTEELQEAQEKLNKMLLVAEEAQSTIHQLQDELDDEHKRNLLLSSSQKILATTSSLPLGSFGLEDYESHDF